MDRSDGSRCWPGTEPRAVSCWPATEIDAAAALDSGLADRAGSPEDAIAWAEEIADLAPLTVAYSKLVLNRMFEPDLDEGTATDLKAAFEGVLGQRGLRRGPPGPDRETRTAIPGPVSIA